MEFGFLQGVGDATDLTTYTFSSQNLGTADASRYIIVGVLSRRAAGTPSISSLTIGGVSAAAVVAQTNTASGSDIAALYIAAVPTGTTGDIVVTFDAAMLRCAVVAYRAVGIASATASDTDSSTATDPTCNLDVPAGGFAIGVACTGNAGASFTWTGLTENYDAVIEALNATSASDTFVAAQTGLAITANGTGATAPVGVFASWAPSLGGSAGSVFDRSRVLDGMTFGGGSTLA